MYEKQSTKVEIVTSYLLSNSVYETATQLGYSYSWVYKVLRQLGIICSKRKVVTISYKNLTEQQKSLIAFDYLDNMPIIQLLSKHKINSSILYLIVRQEKLGSRQKRSSFKWKDLPQEEKANLIAHTLVSSRVGKTRKEIAQHLQLPESRVDKILTEYCTCTIT